MRSSPYIVLIATVALLGSTHPASAQTCTFDAEGRLTLVRYSSTQIVAYAYDAAGNITNSIQTGTMTEPDTEPDGLPDAWELVWFNNLTNTAAGDFNQDTINNLKHYQDGTDPADPDTDGDHSSNVDELAAGTDPTNAASVFQVSGFRSQVSGPVVSWSSVTGKKYRVQRSTNLAAAGFSSLKTNITATPTINVHTDETATAVGPYHCRVQLE